MGVYEIVQWGKEVHQLQVRNERSCVEPGRKNYAFERFE